MFNKKILLTVLAALLLVGLFSGCPEDSEKKPDIPGDVIASVLENGIKITWNPVKNTDNYIIYRREGTSGSGEQLANNVSSSTGEYIDITGTPGTSYSYAVAARNSVGTSDRSSWSESKVFPGSVVQIPEAPTNLTATAQNSSSITISWTASTGAVGYKVYRDESASGNFTTCIAGSTTLLAGTAYTDTELQPNKDYFYKVTAVNSTGESEKSSTATAKTLQSSQPGEVDFGSDPNGTITIINATIYDMVLFVNQPSLANLIGGVYAGDSVVKDISNKVIDFNIGGPVIIQAMKKTEYDANIETLRNAKIEYSTMTSYGQGKQFRATLTSDWDGNFGYRVRNSTMNSGLELRKGNVFGEKIAYISPGENMLLRSKTIDTIDLFPVWVAYNTQSKSLVYYETTDWRDTERAGPRTEADGYQQIIFPPDNVAINWENVTLPFATIVAVNTSGRLAEFNLGTTRLNSQDNFPNINPGQTATYDITGGPGEGTSLSLRFSPMATVYVPLRAPNAELNEIPKIKNGYIYDVELRYLGDNFGNDIMNPLNYSAIITEREKIDIRQFLIVQVQ